MKFNGSDLNTSLCVRTFPSDNIPFGGNSDYLQLLLKRTLIDEYLNRMVLIKGCSLA